MTETVWGPPPSLPSTAPPRQVDVAIVGGGITGLSLLAELRHSGLRCAVLERERVGAGASGRNAGFLLSGVAASYASAVYQYGRTVAADVWAFTAANHDLLLETLGAAAAARAGHRRAGAWTLARDEDDSDELRQSAELLAEDGVAVSWVIRPKGAPPWCRGGLLTAVDGEIHPLAACAELATRLVETQAGLICEGVEVTAIAPASGGIRLATRRHGELLASICVLATNGWTAELAAVPIRAVRAQMLATAPAAAGPGVGPAYSHHGNRYWRRLGSGAVVLGGCRDLEPEIEVGVDQRPTASLQRHLDGFLVGELGVDAAVTHRWAGTMGFSPDGLPLVGAVPGLPGVHVCGGYTGHGMGFAVHCARVLARQLRGSAPPPSWLDPARFDAARS